MGWGWGRRRHRDYGYSRFPEYVPVAQRRANAEAQAKKLAAKGTTLQPVRLESKKIAHTFWGNAWCENLESYSDYANRLPRGRSYVRNGSVLHLDVRKGEIEALVSGSSLYKIKIGIKPVPAAKWAALCRECAGKIGSLMELLAGRLSDSVMDVMTRPASGLFPSPAEIKLDCSCPDWADMCKHVAAVLYGVGARLDRSPELLFLLRHVDHNELVTQASAVTALTEGTGAAGAATLAAADMGAVFGIELAPDTPPQPVRTTRRTAKEMTPSPVKPARKTRSPGKKKTPAAGKAAKRTTKAVAKRRAKPRAGNRRTKPTD